MHLKPQGCGAARGSIPTHHIVSFTPLVTQGCVNFSQLEAARKNSWNFLKTSVAKHVSRDFGWSRHRPADSPSYCNVHISPFTLEHIKFQLMGCVHAEICAFIAARSSVTPEITMSSFLTYKNSSTKISALLQVNVSATPEMPS